MNQAQYKETLPKVSSLVERHDENNHFCIERADIYIILDILTFVVSDDKWTFYVAFYRNFV